MDISSFKEQMVLNIESKINILNQIILDLEYHKEFVNNDNSITIHNIEQVKEEIKSSEKYGEFLFCYVDTNNRCHIITAINNSHFISRCTNLCV